MYNFKEEVMVCAFSFGQWITEYKQTQTRNYDENGKVSVEEGRDMRFAVAK